MAFQLAASAQAPPKVLGDVVTKMRSYIAGWFPVAHHNWRKKGKSGDPRCGAMQAFEVVRFIGVVEEAGRIIFYCLVVDPSLVRVRIVCQQECLLRCPRQTPPLV